MLFVPTAVRAFVEGIKKTDIANDSARALRRYHCIVVARYGQIQSSQERTRKRKATQPAGGTVAVSRFTGLTVLSWLLSAASNVPLPVPSSQKCCAVRGDAIHEPV